MTAQTTAEKIVERLLRPKEVAVRLAINYHEVLRLIRDGELPSVAIPGRKTYRVSERDLEAFIERGRSGKVGHSSGHNTPATTVQLQQTTTRRKSRQDEEYVVKPNWFKKFQS